MLNFIRIFLSAKDIVKRMKIQAIVWDKILTKHISEKYTKNP